MQVYANEFAAKTGYPLGLIKRLCKEGVLLYIPIGRKYLLDFEAARLQIEAYRQNLQMSKRQPVVTVTEKKKHTVKKKASFMDELKALTKPVCKQGGDIAGDMAK